MSVTALDTAIVATVATPEQINPAAYFGSGALIEESSMSAMFNGYFKNEEEAPINVPVKPTLKNRVQGFEGYCGDSVLEVPMPKPGLASKVNNALVSKL